MAFKSAGKLPSPKLKEKIQRSPNYREGAFQNMSPTPMKTEGVSYWKMMREFMKKHPGTQPSHPIPFIKPDFDNTRANEPFIVWFGHSSYLIKIDGKTILVDPVFSGHASPFSFMVKAFKGANEFKTEHLPTIDFIILSHDHYDHLDYKTIREIGKTAGHIYCSLGVSSHLEYWGIAENKITELDWWDSAKVSETLFLTAAPARHFSGRGLKRGQSLWSSFILKSRSLNLYLGGDSGYDDHFQKIGNEYGPFDLAILESGQYNKMWPLIHMMPEETVQAALDLKAKVLLPVHWGKFKLGMHPWNEPVKRVVAKAGEANLKVITPQLGEMISLDQVDLLELNRWWE